MLIDWFTVGAQAINFIVLIGLLKHFLYQPVLDAVDAREARIAGQLADAQALQAKAVAERDALHARHEAFEHERQALLKQAVHDAQVERQRLVNEATHEADALKAKGVEFKVYDGYGQDADAIWGSPGVRFCVTPRGSTRPTSWSWNPPMAIAGTGISMPSSCSATRA